MKILVFGRTGQVATELGRRRDIIALGRREVDLTVAGAAASAIAEHAPDLLINAAAYTAVDRAESDADLARKLNADAPGEMARAAAALGIPLVHVSTDYVYAGTGVAPWKPDDAPGPLGVYGRTKLAGDLGVVAAGGRYAILRTSWVFSAHGQNYVKTMLRLGQERDELSIVADQIGGPTSAASIADAVITVGEGLVAGRGRSGIFHFSGAPETSWAGFSREIFAQAGLEVVVREIATSEYPTPAKRPLNSRLDCRDIAREYGLQQPDWRADLADVLRELGQGGD